MRPELHSVRILTLESNLVCGVNVISKVLIYFHFKYNVEETKMSNKSNLGRCCCQGL